jgi:hypothetical protein
MRRISMFFAVVVLSLATASDSLAARFTAFLDPLETALQARVEDPATDAKLRKLFQGHLKKLAKTTTSLAQDVKTAASILPALEKKASADAALLAVAQDVVDDLAASVGSYLLTVENRANGLRAKKDPLVKIDSLLLKSRTLFATALAQGAVAARIKALFAALATGTKANNAVTRAVNSGGGGGGGGGGACGPTPKPAGLRVLGNGESFTAHVIDFDRTYDFVGSSVTARVTPSQSAPGNPNVLEVIAYDCAKEAAFGFTIPYPPVVNQTYVNGLFQNPAVEALYQYQWDGLTQIFPGGVSLKATAFDQQAKTATIEFTQGISIVGTATIRGWQ